MSSPVPSASFQYYGDRYWNSIELVRLELMRRATDSDQHWCHKLLEWNGKPFQKALALNCGNGWVERDLLHMGVVGSAIGVDISESLLAEARAAAEAEGLDAEYHRVDTNTADLDFPGVDLVVNYAAMHHVARIDRVMRAFCRLLPEDGAFVSWDYIGPHRNQYPEQQWRAIERLNESLPAAMRKQLAYPHLATMLIDDPTEAIHSELIMSTMRRYFHLDHVRYLGGALAYEILCFNDGFFDGNDHSELVQRVIDADAAHMSTEPEDNTLFAFVLARPNKAALDDQATLDRWTQEEDEREAAATARGGVYYPVTSVAKRWYPDPVTHRRSLVRRVGSRAKRLLRRMGVPVDRLTRR